LSLVSNEKKTILSWQNTKPTFTSLLDIFQQVLDFCIWITTKWSLRKAPNNESFSKYLKESLFFALVLLLLVALGNWSMPLCLLLDIPTSEHFHKASITLVKLI